MPLKKEVEMMTDVDAAEILKDVSHYLEMLLNPSHIYHLQCEATLVCPPVLPNLQTKETNYPNILSTFLMEEEIAKKH
jgi:hypothetical protein